MGVDNGRFGGQRYLFTLLFIPHCSTEKCNNPQQDGLPVTRPPVPFTFTATIQSTIYPLDRIPQTPDKKEITNSPTKHEVANCFWFRVGIYPFDVSFSRSAYGDAHALETDNDCVNLPQEFRTIVSSFTRDLHWYGVRLWQDYNCKGENGWYPAEKIWSFDYVGDRMNDKVVSVSSCSDGLYRRCDLEAGSIGVGAVGAGILSFFSFGISEAIGLAAIPAATLAYWNSDCRFCFNQNCRSVMKKRSLFPELISTIDAENPSVVKPTITRNRKAEKMVLPLIFARLDDLGQIDESGLAGIFDSFFQPEDLDNCYLVQKKAEYIQAMIAVFDKNKDSTIDATEFTEARQFYQSENPKRF